MFVFRALVSVARRNPLEGQGDLKDLGNFLQWMCLALLTHGIAQRVLEVSIGRIPAHMKPVGNSDDGLALVPAHKLDREESQLEIEERRWFGEVSWHAMQGKRVNSVDSAVVSPHGCFTVLVFGFVCEALESLSFWLFHAWRLSHWFNRTDEASSRPAAFDAIWPGRSPATPA